MRSPLPQCTVGSQVAMRVGGDFFFDPSPSDPAVDLLLVAGGVGINPLYSILLHSTDLMRLSHSSGGRDYNLGSVHLSYSAKDTQELLFKVWSQKRGFVSSWVGAHVYNTAGARVTLGEQLLCVFPELHHRGVSGIPWQVLLWFPRHAAERGCRPVPHAFSQAWVTLPCTNIYRVVTSCDRHYREKRWRKGCFDGFIDWIVSLQVEGSRRRSYSPGWTHRRPCVSSAGRRPWSKRCQKPCRPADSRKRESFLRNGGRNPFYLPTYLRLYTLKPFEFSLCVDARALLRGKTGLVESRGSPISTAVIRALFTNCWDSRRSSQEDSI